MVAAEDGLADVVMLVAVGEFDVVAPDPSDGYDVDGPDSGNPGGVYAGN